MGFCITSDCIGLCRDESSDSTVYFEDNKYNTLYQQFGKFVENYPFDTIKPDL